MSNIEERTRTLASGMLIGHRRLLHPSQQVLLGKWAVLKVLVSQRGFPDNAIPDAQYREFYERRFESDPPPGLCVSTGRVAWSRGAAPPLYYRLNWLSPKGHDVSVKTDFGYLATFALLDLVVQVLWFRDGELRELKHPSDVAEEMRVIWPAIDTFAWPRGAALTNVGLSAVSGDRDVQMRQQAA